MRENYQKQLPLMPSISCHSQSKELQYISDLIDKDRSICDLVLQDLNRGKNIAHRKGAKGMSADQVLRCLIVKILFQFSYKDLSFHISDSQSISRFCRIGIADKGFKKSALNKNIKSISAGTLEKINMILLEAAKEKGLEKGREVRVDCTCVESNVHSPTDSTLLWDCIRVLTRLMVRCKEDCQITIPDFHNHTRVAKRRLVAILNAKRKKHRKSAYMDLLKVTNKVVKYAERTMKSIENKPTSGLTALALSLEMQRNIELTQSIVEQTKRRVINGEKVKAEDKVVSIFEPHTDIIVKDRRDTFYGHKICLTGGASNLVLDCIITEGNPADATLTIPMLDRQKEIYGRYPLKATFDGGFASKNNLKDAKLHVKDVCFSKKRGLKESDMCRSTYVYKRLKRFRAGIESGISWLKRSMGMTRCNWKGFSSFKAYVWSSIISANLLTMARKELKV